MTSATRIFGTMMTVMALACLMPAAVSQADELIDQSNSFVGNYGPMLYGPADNEFFVQTFVPTKPKLRGVRLNLGDVSSGGEFAVGIFNQVGHIPTGSTLGSIEVNTSTINDNQLTDEEFIFGAPISVSPGTRYAIQISQVSGPRFRPYMSSSDTYADGTFARKQAGAWEVTAGGSAQDMAFQTLWIPEPATLGLMTLGGLMLLRRSRRA